MEHHNNQIANLTNQQMNNINDFKMSKLPFIKIHVNKDINDNWNTESGWKYKFHSLIPKDIYGHYLRQTTRVIFVYTILPYTRMEREYILENNTIIQLYNRFIIDME